MAEWTIDVETPPDRTGSEDALEQLLEALERSGIALGPACGLNTQTGVASAIYQVGAHSFFDAMHLGHAAWIAATAVADISPTPGAYAQRPASGVPG